MNIMSSVQCTSNYATKAKNCIKKNFVSVLIGATGGFVAANAPIIDSKTIPDVVAERVRTYQGLKDNGVDILPYIGNYGKAQAALDSIGYARIGMKKPETMAEQLESLKRFNRLSQENREELLKLSNDLNAVVQKDSK